MVGGVVIGVSRTRHETLLNVRDNNRHGDECAVRCREVRNDTNEPVQIAVGDQVWWQCGKVYWTPMPRRPCHPVHKTEDIPLDKIGYSH